MRAASVEPLAHDFARRVSDYSGLQLTGELPPLEVVDRSAWIAANLRDDAPAARAADRALGEQSGLLARPAALGLGSDARRPGRAR